MKKKETNQTNQITETTETTKTAKTKKHKVKEAPKPKVRMTKEQKKAYIKHRLKTNIRIMPFLAPSLIGVLLFYLVPYCVVIFYTFVDNPITLEFVGFSNLIDVITNPSFLLASWNTVKFSLIAVPLAVILSLLLALLLDHKIPFASQFRTSFLSPMVVPVASVVLVFQVIFDYNGVANVAVRFFGGGRVDWLKSGFGLYVVMLLFLWKNLGYNMILFLGALGTIPKDCLEAAYLDTTSTWKIFWSIKIRYLSPTILFVTIISIINSFKVFREVYMLTGAHPYESVYILQHYMNNKFESMDYQQLSAAAVIMSIVMGGAIFAMYVAENKFGQDMEE